MAEESVLSAGITGIKVRQDTQIHFTDGDGKSLGVDFADLPTLLMDAKDTLTEWYVSTADEEKYETVARAAVTLKAPESSSGARGGNVFVLRVKEVCALVIVVNVGLVCAHGSPTPTTEAWYVALFVNLGVWFCLCKNGRDIQATTPVKRSSLKKSLTAPIPVPEEPVYEEEKEEKDITTKPTAGTTTVKLKETTDSTSVNGHIFGGWRAPGGDALLVRSHGYMSSKQKIPSPGELYECVNVDIFESPHRYPNMASRVQLPKIQYPHIANKTWHAPDVFVVSIALPTGPPKITNSNVTDGGGYTITMYFCMKQTTRDILERVTADDYKGETDQPDDSQTSQVNAVKLFEEWCRRAPTDTNFQSRFKLVPSAQNLKEIGMPSWIAKYNGTPMLIKRPGQTGFLYSHSELSCMEFDISLHPFPFVAKKALCVLKENFFSKVVMTFGFVIEGRKDEELPECLIGLMQLCYPDPQYAIQAADLFSGKSPKSFS